MSARRALVRMAGRVVEAAARDALSAGLTDLGTRLARHASRRLGLDGEDAPREERAPEPSTRCRR